MSPQAIESQNQTQPPLQVWNSLMNICLPPPGNKDIEFWWHLTGPQLAFMLEAAGYSSAKQYEVPRLGPAPNLDGQPAFKSSVVDDGSPLEYSWKWNTSTGEPEIRYVFEAIGPGSGTVADTLNHGPTMKYLAEMDFIFPDANFSAYCSIMRGLYNLDRAVEFNKKASFGLKSYFLVRELFRGGQPASRQQLDAATAKLTQKYPGHAMLTEFRKHNPEGQRMRLITIGLDNVAPHGRLKIYYASPSTSFRAVREVMTMGGRRAVPEASLQDLRSLILAVLGLAADHPEEAEMAAGAAVETGGGPEPDDAPGAGYTYFFDIARGGATPEVKFYLPTRQHGADDLTITRNLVAWLRLRGRAAYTDAYLAALEQIASHRGLAHGKGIHTHISYQCTAEGEPDIKCYIGPEVYHRARYTTADGSTRPELKDNTEDIAMSA